MWSSKQTFQASSSTTLPITPKSSELASTSVITSLGTDPDLGAEGNISGNEELRINGAVAAPISLKCLRLTVGRAGRVTAEVVARQVIVYGQLFGNLRAGDRIEIKKDAVVVGDLITARILIEDGAYFKGNVEIERRKAPRGLPARTAGR
jgi:cytoskeletal protein CcmA (bactofilin family)